MKFKYEDLEVAKKIKKLIVKIYKIADNFPSCEVYGLNSQIKRATTSILLNLAEGSGRQSKKEFNQFVRISVSSLIEVDCILKICIDLKYINQSDYEKVSPEIQEIYFKLIGLSKYLRGLNNN